MPLQVAYTLPLHSRWSLSAQASALVSDNLGTSTILDIPYRAKSSTRFDPDAFKQIYKTVSAWGCFALQAEYKLSDRVAMFAGPAFRHMLSDFLKVPDGAPYRASERLYFVNVDIGARIRLKGRSPHIPAGQSGVGA